jgi:diguanylate cyclase (GGDEF)-like protein
MDIIEDGSTLGEEAIFEQLDGLAGDKALTLDLVSAIAGDREMSKTEKKFIEDFKNDRGDKFYSELLYAVTHQFFPPSAAEQLWNQILQHKYGMSFIMKRNIRIAVATLDYLSNLTGEMHAPTVIDETRMSAIIQLTMRDGLTKLFNHATCFQRIEMELRRFKRYGTIVSLMMIDIDNFKEINDRYGHVEGDKILAMLGMIFKQETRDSDICCRYGGEEFTIIQPSTDCTESGILAERLRTNVEQSMPLNRKVTVSIGVASCDKIVCTSKTLIEKADAALYKAKHDGKNRVVINSEPGIQAALPEDDRRETATPG